MANKQDSERSARPSDEFPIAIGIKLQPGLFYRIFSMYLPIVLGLVLAEIQAIIEFSNHSFGRSEGYKKKNFVCYIFIQTFYHAFCNLILNVDS